MGRKSKMRIVVLAHALTTAGGRSVGLNILASLARVKPALDILAVVPDDAEYQGLAEWANVQVETFGSGGRIQRLLFDRFELPNLVQDARPDWVLGLGNFGLRNPPSRQAILLHKAQLVYPVKNRPFESSKERFVNALIRRNLANSLASTQIVFCQTDVMRSRFSSAFPSFLGMTRLMPNAVSEKVAVSGHPAAPIEFTQTKRKTKLFSLTRYYPHENLEMIVECFDRDRERLADVACFLTISPDQDPKAEALLERIQDLDLGDAIINVGPLEQSRLPAFFYNSDALLLPTLLESFSGTYLEAMSFNCPILTSDLDFARELCGETALYFDPWDPRAMCTAILELKSKESVRAKLISACEPRRSQHHQSWDKIINDAVASLLKIQQE